MTKQEFLQVAEWSADGVLQYNHPIGWTDFTGAISLQEQFSNYYRRKPKAKLHPWKPEEVPVGALIRWKHNPCVKYIILSCHDDRKSLCFCNCVGKIVSEDFSYCFDKFEHSTDQGNTWLPCGVCLEDGE